MSSLSGFNSLALSFNSDRAAPRQSRDRNSQSQSQQARKFLRFYLGNNNLAVSSMASKDLALLEAEIVTEVITVSLQKILPVPQMPYCVLGIYSWRSEMLWIVDVENLLGYPPSLSEAPTKDDTILVMVVQVQGQSMGLVVSQIDNIIEQNIDDLKSSSSELFSEEIMPFLHGYFTDDRNNIITLINAEEIFRFFAINPSLSNYK